MKELSEQVSALDKRLCDAEKISSDSAEMKQQLVIIAGKLDSLNVIAKDITDIKDALEFTNHEIEEMKKELAGALKDIRKSKDEVCALKKENSELKKNVQIMRKNVEENSYSLRENNIIIRNFPLIRNENLKEVAIKIAKGIKYNLHDDAIRRITRFKGKGKDVNGLIMIVFREREIRNEFLVSAKAAKLTAEKAGFKGNLDKIFFSEDLTPFTSFLLCKGTGSQEIIEVVICVVQIWEGIPKEGR